MKAQDLAHYIINRSIDNQTYIGNLQNIVENELEAWLYGPIVPKIYNKTLS